MKIKEVCDRSIGILKFKRGLGFSPEFWLKSIVHLNYVGKVFSVLSLLTEALNQNESDDTKWSKEEKMTCYSYIVFMLLGNYWYTHFWGSESDREAFFEDYYCKKNKCKHALAIVNPKLIVFGAFSYYILYSILFYRIGKKKDKDKKFRLRNLFKTLSFWNLFISGNLLFLLWSMSDKSPPSKPFLY